MNEDEVHAIVSSREFRRFHNALRILHNLDDRDLRLSPAHCEVFRQNPWRFFIICSDETAAKLWREIELTQPEELREP